MEEKYFIIDNAGQYFLLLKCTKSDAQISITHSKKCLTQEGALDIIKISAWLMKMNIRHTIIIGKIENLILKNLIKRDIDTTLRKVLKKDLLISEMEVEKLMMKSKEARDKQFW